MKQISTLLIGLFIISSLSFGSNLKANLSFCSFWSPQDGPFIETYLSVDASSVILQQFENGFRGVVEVTMVFKQGEKIANFKKYELNSPLIMDTSLIALNFIDQQRFVLPSGIYDFQIQLRDKYGDTNVVRHEQTININFPSDEISISGIELLESYTKAGDAGAITKSGYDLVPFVYNFFPESVSKMKFYSELYNTLNVFGENYQFLANIFVKSFETGEVIKDLRKIRKLTSAPVIPLLQELDLTKLPSGNYFLVVEVRNQQNEMVANNELFFRRINPSVQLQLKDIAALDISASFVEKMTNMDTLSDNIRSLAPISSELERVFAEKHLANADLALMQQYFLNFWLERNQLTPLEAWENYHKAVEHVNEHFSTLIKKGYETDRGRVYLKHGPPNTIAESHHEPSAYPYEIWHYYALDNQRNKKFVFYSRDLVTNDFELLHSDAMGEIANYRWQVDVMKRTTDGYDLDQQNTQDHWGGKIDTYYRDPR